MNAYAGPERRSLDRNMPAAVGSWVDHMGERIHYVRTGERLVEVESRRVALHEAHLHNFLNGHATIGGAG